MINKFDAQTELNLIHRAITGEEDAFTDIVEAYQNPVYSLCYRMLGIPQAAEDAAQESFWRAYRKLDAYDENRLFGTWLLSIAAHYCIDQLRRKRLPTMDLDEMIEYSAQDPAPDPEISLIESEFSEEVQRQLSALGEKDRAVLILRYWHDCSEAEISQVLSISTSAVKSRLHRARQHMAQQWTDKEKNLRMEGGIKNPQTI